MTLAPIYCSECGAQNVPGAKFCVTCGHPMHIPEAEMSPAAINALGTGLLPQNSLLNKRYRILKLVGTGGMGAVYKAQDTRFGDRPVAVKEMRQSSLSPQELEIATEQFKIEANMLARLQHPSLPRIYEHFLAGNRWYLVMDFIDGETLDERLRRTPGRKLPPPEVVEIGIQLCRVLDYLHTLQPQVIFRDLKPSNVMLTRDGHLYLIDFGIARIFKPGQAKDTKAYGSIGYSAPEQFDREQTTPQADIYSLGITLHECLSGSIPARTPFNMPRLQLSGGQPALERLSTLVTGMISLDKEKRPAGAEQVRQELESIRDGLKQAVYLPLTAQAAASLTQSTPQSSQPSPEPGHLAPTEYISPPPMAATVAVPSFTEGVLGAVPVAANMTQRPTVRRHLMAIGRNQIIAALAGIVIYTIVSFIVGNVLLNAQASSNSFLLNAIFSSQSSNAYPVRWEHFLVGFFIFIPCFFGARFGPLVGVVVAVLGALLGDALSQFLPAWSWFVGFAALGFLPGLAYLRTRGSYKKAGNILLALAYSFVAIVLWSALLLVGDFTYYSIDFGQFPSALLILALVQLVSLVPLVIALVVSNIFTKARAS